MIAQNQGDKHDDVIGVAWAIKNRHDERYYDQNQDGIEDELAWRNAAVSGVHGMNSTLAVDPMNGWGKYFESEHEAWVAYNTARDIALDILNSDSSADITLGATDWSDAYCNGGVCIDTNNDGRYENSTPWERTHFKHSPSTYAPSYCVSTVPAGGCK